MQSVRRASSFEQDKDADNKIKQADDFEIFLVTQDLFGLLADNERSRESSSIALEGICRLGPRTQLIQDLCDVPIVSKRLPVDRFYDVAALDSGFIGGAVRYDQTGLDTFCVLNPRSSI